MDCLLVKGIELMQMIADGKIKDGTKIICEFTQATYVYSEYNKNLIYEGSEDITEDLTLGELITTDFKILEDKIDEIEELSNTDWKEVGVMIGKIYKELLNGFNQVFTSKDENCMTE